MGSRDSLPSETYTISPFSREEMMGAWFFRTMNGPMVPGSVTEDTACSTSVRSGDTICNLITSVISSLPRNLYSFAAASSFSPLAIASSIVPTFRKACSGR